MNNGGKAMNLIEKKKGCALLSPKIFSDQKGKLVIPFSVHDLR